MEGLRAEAANSAFNAEFATKLAQSATVEHSELQRQARDARLRALPLSIFVSLKTQRVYVRQGFEPVLEFPLIIQQPEKPIGTHAFYATETEDGARGWLGVTIDGTVVDAAHAALDRFDLPPEVTTKLGHGTWLGSALILSDEAPSKKTAAGTDFIVILSDQPRGALKIRSPAQQGPVAQDRPLRQQPISAFRSTAQDEHFRHPLGFFP